MRLVDWKALRAIISLSRMQIGRMEKDGKFPKRVRIGFRVFWVHDEVQEWVAAHVANR